MGRGTIAFGGSGFYNIGNLERLIRLVDYLAETNMPDLTRKKLLDSALNALVKGIDLPTSIKLPAVFVAELAERFGDLSDDQRELLAEASDDAVRQAFQQIEFATRHAAEAAAGVYRVEAKLDQVAEAIRLLQRPDTGVAAAISHQPSPRTVFISHDSDGERFAVKLYGKLKEEGFMPWLDKFDMYAGDLQTQLRQQVRSREVFVIVLSPAALESDWVEAELEWARKRERELGKDMLCPVALDDSWKGKMDDVLWRQLKRMYVLDFAKWKTKAFDEPFRKLVLGINQNYGES